MVLAAAPTSSAPPITLKVGEVGPPLALLAGIDRGYFAKQNITVDLVPLVNGPALISATIGGSLDLNFGDTFAWAAAVANGFKVQMFQSSNTGERTGQSLLVDPASGIRSASDLKGKQIGVSGSALSVLIVKLWLQRHGVDPSTVKTVTVTPYLGMAAALKGGHIDAILDNDPYTQQAQKQYGFVSIGTPMDEVVPRGVTMAGYFATTAWLQAHGDVARRFALAYREAAAWANHASPDEKAAVLAKYSPVNLSTLEADVPGIVKSFHYGTWTDGPTDVDATQHWIATAVRNGVLDKEISIKDNLYPTATAARL
jgi:NitT/TauT family transport system substrate-binding protein